MHSLNLQKWMVGAATLAAVGFVSLSKLDAQTILYSTTFDPTEGYFQNSTLSGQPTNGGTGSWDTNDADNGVTTNGLPAGGKSVGQSDFVGGNPVLAGYGSQTDYWGALGGVQHGTTANAGVLPGLSSVYLFRQFSAPGAVPYINFDVDFAIAESTAANGSATNDSFAWTFRSGTTNLFSARFVPEIDPISGQLKFGLHYSVNNGTEVTSTNGVLSSSIYHLKISVNVATNMLNIQLVPTNGDPTFNIGNVSLTGVDITTLDNIAATWLLAAPADANGFYTNAGSNALVFNNYAITVPEPSTWAMSGIGLAGLVVLAYRHRARA